MYRIPSDYFTMQERLTFQGNAPHDISQLKTQYTVTIDDNQARVKQRRRLHTVHRRFRPVHRNIQDLAYLGCIFTS
jgi:hypothetical protein